ncbi:MAG: HAD domain-containing protein [Rhodoferax sp.]|uniref:HAD domain-containing protein n=1 Tax=Rhodoferax sp. TaxID=50421 RepID=UPI00261FC263|nr:HAD domain-containing protein [Rhodoferax sp.]MDD2881097.1 HAD domain-containing protein [Rhodoferax sp.]
MKLCLFLDFDGVMHPQPYRGNAFCQLPLIEDVLREFPSVQIVISSSWREHYDLMSLKRMFSEDISLCVIGTTKFYDPALNHLSNPVTTDFERQREIELWMRENASPDAVWIAVDDYPKWFEPDCPNLLVTSAASGFVEHDKQSLRDMIRARLI